MPRGRPTKTSFKKGDPKNPRKLGKGGRRKGTVNKITADIKQAIMDALNDPRVGGIEWFVRAAQKDLRTYGGLVRAIIPQKLETGPDPDEVARKIRTGMKDEMDDLTGGDEKEKK